MKKMMLLLASLVALTACSQSMQDTKESTSNHTRILGKEQIQY